MSKELKSIIEKVNAKYAKGNKDTKPIINYGRDVRETLQPTFLSTGVPELDKVMGGGYPKGCVTTIFGPMGCGKTALALMAVAQVQKAGGVAVWVNAEPPFPLVTALLVGVNIDDLIIINAKDYGEQILDVIRELLYDSGNRITRKEVDLIVTDSINGLIPKGIIDSIEDKGSEGNTMAVRARMLSQWLEEMSGRGMLREGTIALNIAQTRVALGEYKAPERMSGGKALGFFSKVLVKMAKFRVPGAEDLLGHGVRCTITKNNVVGHLGEAEYQVIYGVGINDAEEVIANAMATDLILKVKGKHYQILLDEVIDVTEGIEAVRTLIRNNQEIKNKLKEKIQSIGVPTKNEHAIDIAGEDLEAGI
jgi:recombination protein RecA